MSAKAKGNLRLCRAGKTTNVNELFMNNLINKILLFALMSLWTVSLSAQVQGAVKNEHGHTLQGVMIVSENGKDITVTDKNGKYDLSVTDESLRLKFSLAGYKSQTLVLGGDTLDVTLTRAETYDLDEPVRFGNYNQNKGDVTGAVARVTGEELRRSPVGNLSMSLAGRLPGLFTRETYSEPARTTTQLWVRGYPSPNGGTAVVVIDGFPYDYNANQLFEYISAHEVESVTVLKDASSQALYGINGANGVIVITTRRGMKQPLKIEAEVNTLLSSGPPLQTMSMHSISLTCAMRQVITITLRTGNIPISASLLSMGISTARSLICIPTTTGGK